VSSTASLGTLTFEPALVLAPMAGATNPPYRKLCREFGAGLVVTEMVSAKGIVANDPKTWSLVDIQPDEHPVAVQLFGCEPEELAEAARRIAAVGADSIDVNMGCPMKKVVKTGRGAALLKDPKRVEAIAAAMSAAVDIPITAKIRAGWEDANAVEIGMALQNGGAAGVTIHGRTRSDMYEHHVDLDVIAKLKAAVDITVIGNGDVRDIESCDRMFQSTGCDAVMIARGCLGNPWVFQELAAHLRGETVKVDRSPSAFGHVVGRHLELYVESFGEKRTCLQFRKHALWYFKGTAGHPVLRKRMANLTSVIAIEDAIREAVEAMETAVRESGTA
jgi:tRNA-dihydrouridine synthase B